MTCILEFWSLQLFLGSFFLFRPQILKQLGCHSLGVCSCWGIHWKSHRILWECRNAIILSSPSSVVGQQLVTQMIHWSGTPWHWNRQQKNTAKGPLESAIRLDMIRLPFMTSVRSFDALWSIRWKHVCLEIFIAQWDVVGGPARGDEATSSSERLANQTLDTRPELTARLPGCSSRGGRWSHISIDNKSQPYCNIWGYRWYIRHYRFNMIQSWPEHVLVHGSVRIILDTTVVNMLQQLTKNDPL